MSGWLSLLLFAVAFFFLMRIGCGAHVGHGGHGHGNGEHEGSSTDPVCGMEVAPNKGFSKYHDGRLLRFCSKSCLDKYEQSPDKYPVAKAGVAHEYTH